MMSSTSVPTPQPARRWWVLAALILGCQLVGILGAVTTGTGTTSWYQTLVKPAFQPPGWLFGPVWTLLYAMMGLAAWRVWDRGAPGPLRRHALMLFGAQLVLNAAWSPVFFGGHAIAAALAILIGLWLVLGATLLAFGRVDRVSALLLVPYLVWVTFAMALNLAILRLN